MSRTELSIKYRKGEEILRTNLNKDEVFDLLSKSLGKTILMDDGEHDVTGRFDRLDPNYEGEIAIGSHNVGAERKSYFWGINNYTITMWNKKQWLRFMPQIDWRIELFEDACGDCINNCRREEGKCELYQEHET